MKKIDECHGCRKDAGLEKPHEGISPPIICFVGFSGSGKTTVVTAVVSALNQRGFSVGTIKHDVHGFSMDTPGKDSFRHKEAGARTSVVTSPWGIGMAAEADHDHQPHELLHLFKGHDIVIAEGFKRAKLPKIEIFRPENGKPPACRFDECLVAVACDTHLDWGVPCFPHSPVDGLADFILELFGMGRPENARRNSGKSDMPS
ncbi:MAG: molybdopterin-guanine dinucleotide biosynthesis protein B [Deltaproteobacteria bacterium]|nr:molybdopterin-guanine dinucleotide biosynthesis protein B [Deltaproteobacteria bacterium]